jgi:TP901 family phage tail tape measure protein
MPIHNVATLAVDIVVNARRARAQLANFQATLQGNSNALRNLSMGIGAFGLAASGILLARKAMQELFEVINAAFQASIQLEKSIISIETIARTGNIQELSVAFFNVGEAVRGASFDEITTGMRTAARAGLKTTEELEALTKAGLRLSQVSGDIVPQKSIEGLAALTINLDESFDKVNNLASGIDILSDNFVTTAGEILTTSARLSGIAEASNISFQEITALSAALLSTRASATTVRSTLTKLFESLQADPKKAADAIGLTTDEYERFHILVRTKLIDAVKQFVQTFGELSPANQAAALKELGLESVRTRQVLRLFVGNLDEVDRALKIVNDEVVTGTSILEKYALQMGTGAAKTEAAKKQWTEFLSELLKGDLAGTLLELGRFANFVGDKLSFGSKSDIGTFILGETPEALALQIRETREEINKLNQELSDYSAGKWTDTNLVTAFTTKRDVSELTDRLALMEEAAKQIAVSSAAKIAGGLGRDELKTTTKDFQDAMSSLRDMGSLTSAFLQQLKEVNEVTKSQSEEERKITEEKRRQAEMEMRAATRAGKRTGGAELETFLIGIGGDTFEQGLVALDKQLAAVEESLFAAGFGAEELAEKLKAARDAAQLAKDDLFDKEEAKDIEETRKRFAGFAKEEAKAVKDAKAELDKVGSGLGKFAGPAGNIASQILELSELLKNETVIGRGLGPLLEKVGIEQILGTKQSPQANFRDATQAWKDAQIQANKEDEITKEQINLAKEMLKLMSEDTKEAKKNTGLLVKAIKASRGLK